MALVPAKIERSVFVVSEFNNHLIISTSFIATFKDGSVKVLNLVEKTLKSLIKESELNDTVRLYQKNCVLFFRDWAKVQSYKNNFKEQYPKPILPDFIENYISK